MTKNIYEKPEIEVVEFFTEDVITTSSGNDENQGEWDPMGV